MVGVVRQWTGHETRLLRRAPRMTIAEFAEHLGVTTRAVDKWEARRASITPRPELQRALDTVLAGADPAVRARLLSRVDGAAHPGSPADASTPEEQPVADADAPSSVESWDLGTRAPGPSSRVPLSRDLSAGLRDVVRAPA
ncbi:MAG: helix-turn-helix domain-containing protein [Kineosporiaceae bacterium]